MSAVYNSLNAVFSTVHKLGLQRLSFAHPGNLDLGFFDPNLETTTSVAAAIEKP